MDTKAQTLRVGKKGRVVLPVSIRREAGITEGSELTGRVTQSGQVILETKDTIKQRIRQRAAAADNTTSVVDQLLEERKADRSLLD